MRSHISLMVRYADTDQMGLAHHANYVAARGKTLHAWTDRELQAVNLARKAPALFEQLKKALHGGRF